MECRWTEELQEDCNCNMCLAAEYLCSHCQGNLEVGVDAPGGLCYWCANYDYDDYDYDKPTGNIEDEIDRMADLMEYGRL